MHKIEELHKLNNKHPEVKNFHLAYNYDNKTKDWNFVGYRCMKCQVLFKHSNTVPKHHESCRGVRKKEMPDFEPTIIDMQRNRWKPYGNNQN